MSHCHHGGAPLCCHGHGRAYSKTLDVKLTFVMCVGVGKELAGVSPVGGDQVGAAVSAGASLELTWSRLSVTVGKG